MRLFALIGAILLLVLPFSFISWSIGDISSGSSAFGLVYTSSEGNFFGWESSESSTFELSWLEENGTYSNYFGDLWIVGIIILILTLITMGFALIDDKNKKRSPIILFVLGIVLMLMRLIELGDSDLSFYKKETGLFGIETTYIEIPLGFVIALIFTILDMKKK